EGCHAPFPAHSLAHIAEVASAGIQRARILDSASLQFVSAVISLKNIVLSAGSFVRMCHTITV
ncbi:hypothetical protein, partial [Pantoea sp. BL1]|uniref:hypothetical protein n=1 Tax=Pantoea sp. BL1 TaxID=1628190 RepID=UPI000AC8806D